METCRVLELLDAIVVASYQAAHSEFQQASRAERGLSGVGNSRAVIAQQIVGVRFANGIVPTIWQAMEPELNRTQLPWTDETVAALKKAFATMLGPVREFLIGPVLSFQGSRAQLAEDGARAIDEALAVQRGGVDAQIELYVADRRRRDIAALLSIIETRLVQSGEGGELLSTVRMAQLEAQTPRPNDGKLKEWLEVISTAIQGINAAHDLGTRLQTMIEWLRTQV